MRYVVDANVAIVANGRPTHAGLALQYAAARFLRSAMQSGVILEDDQNLALGEYKTHLLFAGQPGMGNEFFKWFVEHRWMPEHVCRVAIPEGTSVTDHVPPAVVGFDQDDHKWIAIYRLGDGDYIVNAVDTDYAEWRPQFEALGIWVLELADPTQTS